MGTKALVALDTNHIKHYVFPTAKLKEIRGASSILDRLNRNEMWDIARGIDQQAIRVYTNGGSGLFVVEAEQAQKFCDQVAAKYREQTERGASITCVVQPLRAGLLDDREDLLNADIREELELIRYRLQAEKLCAPDFELFPSHPFLRTCDACGTHYAEGSDQTSGRDADELSRRYCANCLEKRREDMRVKHFIERYQPSRQTATSSRVASPLWEMVLRILSTKGYAIPPGTQRPHDFNDFRQFAGAKGYLGLIYADGNGMGAKTDDFTRLRQWKDFAKTVDAAVYEAVCDAIIAWLPVDTSGSEPLFPFDLLLLGGDDVLMVTPAAVAMDVARTIAQRFYEEANKGQTEANALQTKSNDRGTEKDTKHTLSVGVVLAPASYPFGMLLELAESTLRHAKNVGAQRVKLAKPVDKSEYGDTFLNFLTVTGSTSQDFRKVYASLCEKHGRVSGHTGEVEFSATLRLYTLEQLTALLELIRAGKQLGLGRTKLHQVREAVLKMNLTSSVTEGLGVLRNWRSKQQEFVLEHVYKLGERYQQNHRDAAHPGTLFPRVTFPWFADGPDAYRTSLLDFVELYDFVGQEGAGDANKNGSR